jgi:general secretion pathway protein I
LPLVPAKAGTQGQAKKELDSRLRGNERKRASARRAERGFTLIEVLVALSVVAVALGAIGSLIAVTVRGARSMPARLALVETARAVVTGLPDRDALAPGNFSGELAGHRWRVDVLPFGGNLIDAQSLWAPQTVVVRVQSPSGRIVEIDTVRIRRKTNQ